MRTRILQATVFLALLSAPLHAQDAKAILTMGVLAANAADYATTRLVLAQGGTEQNVLMAGALRHEPLGAAVKFSLASMEGYAVYRLMSSPEHRKWGIALGVGLIVANGYLAVHNARQLR